MQLALFDIDGTLLQCRSELRFWRYLFEHGRQGPKQIVLYALFALRFWPRFGRDTLKKDKAYLAGLNTADVAELARNFVATGLDDYLHPTVRARLAAHLQRGDIAVLLSGTLQPIARALADRLGVQHVCATVCRERGGRYLAEPPQLHPYGALKKQLAQKLVAKFGLEPEQLIAYGNAGRDIDLLEFAGSAVAVRPDGALRAVALRRGWEILD